MDDRLVDLEVRYSYMQRSVTDLDAVILELRAEVEQLKKRIATLEQTAFGKDETDGEVEKPPHY